VWTDPDYALRDIQKRQEDIARAVAVAREPKASKTPKDPEAPVYTQLTAASRACAVGIQRR
jgi:hypothetical protein